MRLDNKGMSIIEIVLTFSLIMVMVVGMVSVALNYRLKASISLEKMDMNTFKNTLTKAIQDDILEKGVKEMNYDGECQTISYLNSCVNIVFMDGSSKIFGTSIVDNNSRESIENKFVYYDGIKYPLNDSLPTTIPDGRSLSDFQMIQIQDSNILGRDSMMLEDGTLVTLYSIDVYISHIDFSEDFGIHILAYNEKTQYE